MTVKMKYSIAKNAEALVKQIESAGMHYAKARRTAQNAAVNVLIHAAKHGDYSYANQLVSAVKTGDAKPLVKWFVEFGGLVISEDQKSFDGWQGKQYIKDKIDAAKATMFWEYKEASPFKGHDLHEQLGKLIDKSEKVLTKLAELESQGQDVSKERELVKVDAKELAALKAVYNSSTAVVQ